VFGEVVEIAVSLDQREPMINAGLRDQCVR
jgi:hypothetical protein